MVPPDKIEYVIANAVAPITIEVAADFVCAGLPPSVTVTVKGVVPVVVGVPEITPVAGARANPAGRVPVVIDHV